jgi:hypothetical protein
LNGEYVAEGPTLLRSTACHSFPDRVTRTHPLASSRHQWR